MTHLPRPLSLVLLGALAAAATPRAHADDLPGTTRFFEAYDRNADGVVTADEFAGSRTVFALLDEDGDGAIQAKELGLPADFKPQRKAPRPAERAERGDGPDERAGRRARRLRQALERMDADGDGRISRAEWRGPDSLFDRLDRNGDATIDEADRRPQRRGGMGGMGGMGGPDGTDPRPTTGSDAQPGTPPDRPNKGPRAGRRDRLRKRVLAMDADGDGRVTAAEWTGRKRLFDRLDRDGDGAITEAELEPPEPGGRHRGRRRGAGLAPPMLDRFDRDRDGRVARAEFPGSDERFDAMDANGDGVLSEADLQPKTDDEDPKETTKDAPTTAADRLRGLDADGDGRLHRGEFDGSDAAWQRLDANEDGWITVEELAKGG